MLQTNHWHITDCRSPVGQLVVCVWQNLLADCWTTVSNSRLTKGRQSTNSWRTVGLQVFLGAPFHNYQNSNHQGEPGSPEKYLTVRRRRGYVGNLGQGETTPCPLTGLFIILLISSTTWTLWEDHLLNISCPVFYKMGSATGMPFNQVSPSLMLYQISSCACFNCLMLTANRNTWNLNSLWILVVVLKLN